MTIKLGGVKFMGDMSKTLAKVSSTGGGGTGPNIVTSGLIMNLDGSVYSGSGDWIDQTGNGNNVTWIYGSNYDPSGWFDYSNSGLGTIPDGGLVYGSGSRTVAAWWKLQYAQGCPILYYGTAPDSMFIFEQPGNFSVPATNFKFRVNVGSGGRLDVPGFYNTEAPWHYTVFTYDGTTSKLYENGSLLAETTDLTINTATGVAYVANDPGGNNNVGPLLGQLLMYNRALTEVEVLQNFNTTRAKYGI